MADASSTDTELSIEEKLRSVEESVEYLKDKTEHRPVIAVICGSGLGFIADLLTNNRVSIPYDQIPNFTATSVPGHDGELVFGTLENFSVVCMKGRVHAHEGHSMWKLAFPIRVFAALGVKVLVSTSTAVGLNSQYLVDDVMIIEDHINLAGLAGLNPFIGLNDSRFGDRFPSMTGAYDKLLRDVVWNASNDLEMKFVQEGVYFCRPGPCFESIAECNMIRKMDADAVGMSMSHEVAVARQCGMRCLGLSLITHVVTSTLDPQDDPPSHQGILDSARRRSIDLKVLVHAIIARITI